MKRLSILAVVLLAAFVTPALADTTASAIASVYMNVNPAIAVIPPAITNMGTFQTGNVPANLVWTISANQEAVSFFLEASDLFKGDDCSNTAVPPIPQNRLVPATMTAQFGNPINSGSNAAFWNGPGSGASIGACPTTLGNTIRFEGSQNSDFSQTITTVFVYNQANFEQPVGQYSGKVRLTAFF